MGLSVRIKTQMSYEEVEALVKRHCANPFEINFEGLEDVNGVTRKVMTLAFNSESDRDAFRVALGTRRA